MAEMITAIEAELAAGQLAARQVSRHGPTIAHCAGSAPAASNGC